MKWHEYESVKTNLYAKLRFFPMCSAQFFKELRHKTVMIFCIKKISLDK